MGRFRSIIPAVIFVVLAVSGLRVFGADFEGVPVNEIRHRPEEAVQQPLGPAELQELLPQKIHEPYSSSKISESIQRLYATGRFSDVQVDASGVPSGVILTFLTKSAYFVGAVEVRGVEAPPGEGQLRSATHLELGRSFSEDDIPAAIESLRRVLQDDGYFQAELTPAYKRDPETQQIDIAFDVRTGARARLGSVQFGGSPIFSPEKLIRQAKWKRGRPLTSAMVQSGLERIRKLYQKENYLAASLGVTAKPFDAEKNSADLEITVQPGTQISISISGASLSRSTLKRLVPVFQEGALDDDLLEEGERNLIEYFQTRGYFDVSIHRERKQNSPSQTAVEFIVHQGMRQKLEEIRITGNRYFSTDALRERMRIEPVGFGLPYGRFSSKLLAADLESLRTLYDKNGFSAAEITSKLETPEGSERYLKVTISVREGQQSRVGSFSFLGNHSFPQPVLESLINGGRGQPYSPSVITSDGDNLLTFYFDEGFPRAKFRFNETPAADKQRLDVQYVIDEGQREYVGHTYVHGLEHTRRGVVNRELQFRDGAPLSQSELLDTQRRLYDLSIFNRVEVAVQNPEGRENQRNVLVYLEEARRYALKIGLGAEVGRFGGSAADRTNVQGENEFSPDVSFQVTRLGMGGRPHTASVSGRFSTLQKRAGITYTAPRLFNHPRLEGSARAFFDETRDVRTFTARRAEGSLQFEEKKSKITTLLSRYAYRRVTVDTDTLKITETEIPILARPILVGMLNQTIIRDTRDNPADSHQGVFTSADVGLAAKQLGSQASFARVLLQNSSYYPFSSRLVFARSTQFGVQSPFGSGRAVELPSQTGQPAERIVTKEIPIAEHFFSGGSNSHRGFAVNQAGPRDPVTGFPLGGNALLLNSLELRFPIWRNSIGGALFHDAGNVFTRASDISLRQHQKSRQDFNYVSHALGFGLRYRTPVGPIRLDLGYNLNPTRFTTPDTNNVDRSPQPQRLARWQLLFSIGQSF
ncbi:MAG: BamA/TamA family outer membrane protein [Acidobacteria bacterium]|nr:BamA/TamA family outer membrane protein [Acidobacteriota bacterium]